LYLILTSSGARPSVLLIATRSRGVSPSITPDAPTSTCYRIHSSRTNQKRLLNLLSSRLQHPQASGGSRRCSHARSWPSCPLETPVQISPFSRSQAVPRSWRSFSHPYATSFGAPCTMSNTGDRDCPRSHGEQKPRNLQEWLLPSVLYPCRGVGVLGHHNNYLLGRLRSGVNPQIQEPVVYCPAAQTRGHLLARFGPFGVADSLARIAKCSVKNCSGMRSPYRPLDRSLMA
jgi:hypothetical protein